MLRTIHRAYEAWNASDIDAGLSLMHERIVWSPPPESPLGGPYEGRAAVRRFFETLLETFDGLVRTPTDFEVRGPHVVVDVRSAARGKGSGATIEVTLTDVFTFDGDLVSRYAVFPDRETAIASLSPPSEVPATEPS